MQKGAPGDLLLGTDMLPHLGFSLIEEQEPTKTYILGDDATTPDPETVTAVVRQIQLAGLPAGHSKVVCVEVTDSRVTGRTCLFEPAVQKLQDRGLTMADALVRVGRENQATVVVANTSVEPVLLEEGAVMGNLQLCSLVPAGAEPEDIPGEICVSLTRQSQNETSD